MAGGEGVGLGGEGGVAGDAVLEEFPLLRHPVPLQAVQDDGDCGAQVEEDVEAQQA